MKDRMEQAALIALLRRRRSGWSQVTGDVEAAGSALSVLTAEDAEGQADLFASDTDTSADVEAALVDLRTWLDDGLQLVTVLDADYPQQLLTVHQRPPFLLYRGTLDDRDASGVAVVGTRNPSPRGLTQAAAIAEGLAARGTVVISGLADGVDAAAHNGALRVGGRTVAVIGTGLNNSYPAKNRALQERIGQEHCVISQFWPDGPPTKTSFPMRNAVMSGYAAATVVIEAAARSGARMQARLALQHGRPVFLLESLLEHEWARDYAARPGATVVSSPEDVLEALDDILRPATELVWS